LRLGKAVGRAKQELLFDTGRTPRVGRRESGFRFAQFFIVLSRTYIINEEELPFTHTPPLARF
jgi:hypothetical protein